MDKYLNNMMIDLDDDIVEEISNMVPGVSKVDHTHISNKIFKEIGLNSKTIMKKEKYIRKANKWAKAVAFAACFCIVIGVGLFALPSILNLGRMPIEPSTTGTDDGSIISTNDNATDSKNGDPFNTLYYSSLNLKSGNGVNIECPEIDTNKDIVAFNEDMLANCEAILEGTITNIIPKEYAYTYERNGIIYHHTRNTIVYEMSVEKVWYGDFDGTTCLIEDSIWFIENIISMKAGCSYVIPVNNVGSEFSEVGTYVSGDIKRISNYSTIYPYHPQITITAHGDYIVTSDWSILTSINAKKIVMDIELGKNASYYKDKFMLVSADDFSSQMAKLIKNTILNEFNG